MTTVNRAVKEHLAQVVDGERHRTARFLVRARAGAALVYLALTAWFAFVRDEADWRATFPLLAAYATVAVAIALVVGQRERLARLAGLSVALLDVPTLTTASLLAIPNMARPEYLLGALAPTLLALVVLSALALDYPAIVLATLAGCVAASTLVMALRAPAAELVAPLITCVGVGVLCVFLVSRLRALVEESRRKDFAGKYILGERVGTGGMAEVFQATYSPAGGFERRVAVKRVLPAYAEDEGFLTMFRREAELGAQLAHPNLVQVLDFGRHLESWFLAMEYVDGLTLSALIRARGDTVPLSAALYVVAEVAEGLAYLHEKPAPGAGGVGLVHRDLNPPNVLLSRLGEVKISDFGVARWQHTPGVTQAGTVRGKLAYMAPEQLDGRPPAPGWDLFALGVTAHELLTGQRLFTAESETQLMRRVLEQEIPRPSTRRPGLCAEVDALVLQLLAREPALRVGSARDVVRRLRALEGPDAPFPAGRPALVEVISQLGPTAPAQAPGTPSAPALARTDAATVTVSRTERGG